MQKTEVMGQADMRQKTTSSGSRMLRWILSSLLTTLAVYGIFLTFFQTFYEEELPIALVLILVPVVSALFCGGFLYIRHFGFVCLGVGLLIGVWFCFHRQAFLGGWIEMINRPIYALAVQRRLSLFCLTESKDLAKAADLSSALFLVLMLLTILHAFCLSKHRLLVIPIVIGLFSFAYPVLVEVNVNGYAMALELAVLVGLLAVGFSLTVIHKEEKEGCREALTVGTGLCLAVFLAGTIAVTVRPSSDFVRNEAWSTVTDKCVEVGENLQKEGQELVNILRSGGTIFDYLQEKNVRLPYIEGGNQLKITNSIGAGKLGQTDELGGTGNEVMTVTTPAKIGKVYLMGYVGQSYHGNTSKYSYASWSEPDESFYGWLGQSLESTGFLPQTSTGKLFEIYSSDYSENPDYFQTEGVDKILTCLDTTAWYSLKTSFTGIAKTRQFTPVMPTSYMEKYEVNMDGTFGLIDDKDSLTFYSFDRDSIVAMQKMLGQYQENSMYSSYMIPGLDDYMMGEYQYSEYVMSHYRNVDTPRTDEIVSLSREIANEALQESGSEAQVEFGLLISGDSADDAAIGLGSGYYSLAEEEYTIVEAIREYLAENYRYTTSPGELPDGEDFVDYFLFDTKEGYCTYFASAAVMMLRSVGIPARYVEGYVVDTDDPAADQSLSLSYYDPDGNSVDYVDVSVKDTDAHAWVQFYVEGIGWIDYDVTPGLGEDAIAPVEETTEQAVTKETTSKNPASESATTATAKQKESTPSSSTESKTAKDGSSNGTNGSNANGENSLAQLGWTLGGLFLSAILLAAVLYLILNKRKKKNAVSGRTETEIDKEKEIQKAILLNYATFERMIGYAGWKREASESYLSFAEKVEKECPAIGSGEAVYVTKAYEMAAFGMKSEAIAKLPEYDRKMQVILARIKERVLGNMGLFKRIRVKRRLKIR